MELREYRSGDLPELLTLFYNTVHIVNARDYTPDQLDAWADGTPDTAAWDRSLREHRTLVAVQDGRMVGFADLAADGHLDRLYVHHAWQGRGVATRLCDALESGSDVPRLYTEASLTARGFFLRRGYRVVQRQQVVRHGVAMTNFRMEKIRTQRSCNDA